MTLETVLTPLLALACVIALAWGLYERASRETW